jgi:predicted RNA methylase
VTATALRDLWTTSPSYRQLYQSPQEVEAVVRLLEMPAATALADVGCGNGTFAVAAARANPGRVASSRLTRCTAACGFEQREEPLIAERGHWRRLIDDIATDRAAFAERLGLGEVD